MNTRKITGAQALNEALHEEMERDSNIILLGEDIGKFGGRHSVTDGLLERFGSKRVIDTPINEELFMGIAIGAAQVGLRPVIEFAHGTFATIDLNNIRRAGIWDWISGYKLRVPIVIRVKWGTGRSDGFGHELSSSVLSSLINHMGLAIVAPSTPRQAKGLLKTSLRGDKPVIFLEPGKLYDYMDEVPVEDYTLPFGCAELTKEGKDISVITHASLTNFAKKAAANPILKGIDLEILNLVSIKPLDEAKIIETAQKTKRVIILDDEPDPLNALSAKLTALIYQKCPGAHVRWFGPKRVPLPFGPLEREVLPQGEAFINEVKRFYYSTPN